MPITIAAYFESLRGRRHPPLTSLGHHSVGAMFRGCGSCAVSGSGPGAAGSCGACGTSRGRPGVAVCHRDVTSLWFWAPQCHIAVAAGGQGRVTGGGYGTGGPGGWRGWRGGGAGGKIRGPGPRRPPGPSPGKSRTHCSFIPVVRAVAGSAARTSGAGGWRWHPGRRAPQPRERLPPHEARACPASCKLTGLIPGYRVDPGPWGVPDQPRNPDPPAIGHQMSRRVRENHQPRMRKQARRVNRMVG